MFGVSAVLGVEREEQLAGVHRRNARLIELARVQRQRLAAPRRVWIRCDKEV